MNRYHLIPLGLLLFLLVFAGCDQYVPDDGTHDNPVDPGNPGAPDIPIEIYPEDGQENVELNPELSWYSADPESDVITFDVYFGTSSTPDLVSEDQSAGSYSPGRLTHNTKYYWRVIVSDGDHSIAGPLWSFRTIPTPNNPPNTPSSPNPVNNETGVEALTQLTWTCSDDDEDDLTYDLYFGTSSTPTLFVEGVTGASYSLMHSKFATTYFWKVVVSDGIDEVEGPVWSFTVENNGGTSPYPDVTETGLPYTIVVNSASIDGAGIASGDVIAVFDTDQCVGWGVKDGGTLVITAWESDPDNGITTGFSSGNTMNFQIWDSSTNTVVWTDVSMVDGDGLFGYEPYSVVILTGLTTR